MLIKKLILHNFRQFIETQEISFSTDKEKNVTVLIGINTSGKTTLIRAFEWILYNKNEFDDKILLNKNVAGNMQAGDTQAVRGTLVLEHNGKEYEISRKQIYTCTGSCVRPSSTTADILYLQPDGQTKTRLGSEFSSNIERILPKALSNYFFFGGERIGSISSREDIESSVKGLMGLDVLYNAMAHLRSVINKLKKSMDFSGDQQAADAQKMLEDANRRKKEYENELANIGEQIEYYQAEKEKYAALLRANEETAAEQRRREQLDAVIKGLVDRIEKDKKSLVSAFSRNAFAFFSLPLLQQSAELLNQMGDETESVPEMSGASIDYILKRGTCICGTCISEGSAAEKHLLAERSKQPPESIGSLVRRYREQAMDYISSSEDYYSSIEERFMSLRSNQRELGFLIDEKKALDERLKGAKDVSELEKNYQAAAKRREEFEQKKTDLIEVIGVCKKDIENAETTLDAFGEDNQKNARITLNIEYATAVLEWIAEAYKARESTVRRKLEERVNANFSLMYHGSRNSGIRNSIENYLFYRDNAADDFEDSQIRICHSQIDKQRYDRIISAEMLPQCGGIDLDTINEGSSRIEQCYHFYREALRDQGDDALKRLFNLMFDKDKKVLVLIELKQGDVNEQVIFDTINRAGVHLSTADIIKNNLYKHFLSNAGTNSDRQKKVTSVYKTCWDKIFYGEQKTASIWESERVFGNVRHTNLEFLLYCVACIKWGEEGDMFSKLEDVYERNTRDMEYHEFLNLAIEIKEYAIIFKKYILDFKISLEREESTEYFKYKENVRRLLLILQRFSVQMFYPYVIMRLKEVNQNESDEQLAEDFLILESFVIRRKVSTRGTNDYTKKCYEIIKNGIQHLIASDLANPDSRISDQDMEQRLADINGETSKMILFWIELHRRDSKNIDVDALEYKFTLEHIMPIKWTQHWSDVPIKDRDAVLLPDSKEGMQLRDAAILSIGNQTLLINSLNGSLRNAAFSRKVEGDEAGRPGYKQNTLLLLTREIVDQAKDDPIWDEMHIRKRQADLYKEFITLWPSFSEKYINQIDLPLEENEDPVLDNFTEEQLADAAVLLDALPLTTNLTASENGEIDEFLTQTELVKCFNVQKETVERYIKKGKLVPDRVEQFSDSRNVKYFLASKIPQYAEKFGWTVIYKKNRKKIFMDMVHQMNMSYSYKPIFLKALLQYADVNGRMSAWSIVSYFRQFFDNRRNANLIVEKQNSVYINAQISDDDILRNILTYPFTRFADIGIVSYDKNSHEILINQSIWISFSESEKKEVLDVCNRKLEEYFSALEMQA